MNILRICSEKINTISKLIVMFFILVSVFVLIQGKMAYAENYEAEPSWVSSYPELFSVSPVSGIPQNICSHSLSSEDIAGENNKLDLCVSNSESVSFGYYEGSSYKAYVKFGNDQKMHRVYGTCIQYDSCLYSPKADMLITKQNLINGLVRSLVVYKNYSKRLSSFVNPANLSIEYIFDGSNPDYIFKDSSGYAWPIGGFGMSDNDKWLAIEFRQRGIGLLNLETLDMKRISTMSFSYGTGRDPISELAVANSGKSIAIMGLNSGATIFENNDTCGDLATDENMSRVSLINIPCKSQPIQYGAFIYKFLYATYPRFTDDGYGLDFYAESYNNNKVAVSLRAIGSNVKKLEYLALGDSYSSGEGEISDLYYLDGTNEEHEKCHVSSRSYPFLIADFSNLDLNLVKSVACSGAKTEDIIGSDIYYFGQNNRLGPDGRNLSDTSLILAQADSISSFLPGRIHQEVFVNEYKPKIITIGIGGNDVGMVDKLQACIGPGTCSWASDQKMREQFALEIKALFNTLVNVYQEIHDSSPNSKIFAVGYPRPADGEGVCGPLTGLLLDSEERIFMTEAISYLNQVVKAAAKKVGIGFFDIQESYGNHIMCGSETPSGINSIAIGDDIGLSGESSWVKFIGNESFHPNPYGHLLAATYIYSSIGDISKYNYCADGSVICSSNVSVPEPSEYWIGKAYDDYPSLALSDFVFSGSDQTNQLQKRIILPNFSFLPNSQVKIVINSTPIELGVFDVGDDGSISIDLDLPSSLEEGFHTIFIYGRSYSGDQIDLYQVIKYQKQFLDITKENIKSDNLSTKAIDNADGLVANLAISNENNSTVADIQINTGIKLAIDDSVSKNKSNLPTTPEVFGLSIGNNHTDIEKDTNNNIDNNKMNNEIAVIEIFCGALLVTSIVVIVLIYKKNKKRLG